MLEAYSVNADVTANSAVPFNSVSLVKGKTALLSGTSTIQLNKCGVYMVSFDGSTSADTTVQLYKDGVAQPQAQSTGDELGFVTLVQVIENNSCCACANPTNLQVINTTEATFTNANVVVTKVV